MQSAVEDLAIGIDYIFRHASELKVSTNDYSVWGGSADARMAAYIGSYTPAAFGDFVAERPAIVVMGFGLGTGTSADEWIDGAVKFWEKHIDTIDKKRIDQSNNQI